MELLMTQNAKMNLTAAADMEEAFQMHVEDSLALLPALDAVASEHAQTFDLHGGHGHPEFRIIDVGSGAGLPGAIIAIARPAWKVTLLDSLRKRCQFVEMAVQHIGIQNIQVVWSRAEEAGQSQKHREVYDVAIARAVARMRVLAELCLPMVKPGGYCLAAKGPDCQAEVAEAEEAIAILQGKLVSISKVDAFGSVGQHVAVLVKKVAHTPAQYPRQPGKPGKRPL
ncbi:hypothetical protein ABBQ38_008987 [Trebouxia sp. C0009 RCD-2024]